jgi:hypothetical protein
MTDPVKYGAYPTVSDHFRHEGTDGSNTRGFH